MVVIIPTYNERENLEPMAARVRGAVPDADLLIVDDNSPDGTGELADKLAAGDARIHVLHRPEKAGLGAAYIAGFGWALDRGYDAVVEMDADGSHQPEDLPRLLAGAGPAPTWWSAPAGCRAARCVNWPKSRETALPRREHLHAADAGHRGPATRPAGSAPTGPARCAPSRWTRWTRRDTASRSTSPCAPSRPACTVAEIPITFVERARGHSKMSNAIVREAFWRVAVWGVSAADGQAARPAFAPGAEPGGSRS